MKVTGLIKEAIADKVFEAYRPRIEASMAREEEMVRDLDPMITRLNDRYRRELTDTLNRCGVTLDNNRTHDFSQNAAQYVKCNFCYGYNRGVFPSYLGNRNVGNATYAIVKIAQSHINSIILKLELGESTKVEMLRMLENIRPLDEEVR